MKIKRSYLQRRMTDTDHNLLVDLMSEFKTYPAYKKRIRIYSGDAGSLQAVLKRNFQSYLTKIEVIREGGNKPFVRTYSSSESNRNNLLAKLQEIKRKGKIVANSYTATTTDGTKVELTGTPSPVNDPKSTSIISNNGSGGTSTTTIIIIAVIALLGFFIFKKASK